MRRVDEFRGAGLQQVVVHHLDKQTEFYLAADHLTITGGYKAAQANGFISQSEPGLCMRFKF
jgi:hypothetical protein